MDYGYEYYIAKIMRFLGVKLYIYLTQLSCHVNGKSSDRCDERTRVESLRSSVFNDFLITNNRARRSDKKSCVMFRITIITVL